MALTFRYRAATGLLVAVVLLRCIPAIQRPAELDPVKAPERMWDRLEALRSFGFHLRYNTEVPFEIGAEFEGRWVSPDREYWSGHWLRAGEVTRAELVGAGSEQHQKQDGSWVSSPRGLETNVFEQARSVLHGRQLGFRRETGRSLLYEFTPELRFLDPGLSKQMSGELELDRKYGLPMRIRCHEPGGNAEWLVTFGSFNRAGRIHVPFVPEVELVLKADAWGGPGAMNRAMGVVSRRLDDIGVVHRMRRKWCRAVLQLRRPLQRSIVEIVLSRARAEVWTAARVSGAGADSPGTVAVGGDMAFQVRPVQRFARGKALEASVELEELPEPRLVVGLDRQHIPEASGDSAGLYLFMVDGRALDATAAVSGGKLVFTDIGGREFVRVVSAVVNGGGAPVGFHTLEERTR